MQALFRWVGVEGLSLGEARQRLQQQGVLTPTGQAIWDRSTLRGVLLNPAYQGTARWGKTRLMPKKKEARGQRARSRAQDGRRPSRHPDKIAKATPIEEQETISVPALVETELFQAVADKLEENRRRYRVQKKGTEFLLSGLLVCALCGSAYCGRRHRPKSAGVGHPREYVYYRCLGTDAGASCGHGDLHNGCVPARVEDAVWSDLCSLFSRARTTATRIRAASGTSYSRKRGREATGKIDRGPEATRGASDRCVRERLARQK